MLRKFFTVLPAINKVVELNAGENKAKVDMSNIHYIINRELQQLRHLPYYLDTHAKRVVDNLLSELFTKRLDLYALKSSTEREKEHLYSVFDPSNNDMANNFDILIKQLRLS
ncbi:MAG: hypothetical protein JO131_06545 [Gammaproteobacteria bacterium]|nr:hypothetical protein [Gammaproteobacteria bacterium]